MEFVQEGVRYSLDAQAVRSALRGHAPDDVRTHWVDVDGTRWPPKQALGLGTGLDRSTFTSHRALGILGRLGFRTSPWGAGRQGTVRTAQTRTPVLEAHAGSAYCEPLIRPLAEAGATLAQPLAGLRQGERLSWYGSSPVGPDESVGIPAVPEVARLLDERHAVPPAEFLAAGRTSSDRPGLYSWWADVEGAHELSAGLGHRVPAGLVYAGRAGGVRPNGVSSTNTLWGRVATMHLGGNRDFSTFRLTLAACLSRPDQLPIAEADLTTWMHEHLRVATMPLPPEQVTAGEDLLLELTNAPLNLRDVPPTPLRKTLSALRSAIRGR